MFKDLIYNMFILFVFAIGLFLVSTLTPGDNWEYTVIALPILMFILLMSTASKEGIKDSILLNEIINKQQEFTLNNYEGLVSITLLDNKVFVSLEDGGRVSFDTEENTIINFHISTIEDGKKDAKEFISSALWEHLDNPPEELSNLFRNILAYNTVSAIMSKKILGLD